MFVEVSSQVSTAIISSESFTTVITADVEKMTEEANSEVSEEREAKKIGELASVRRQRQRQVTDHLSLSCFFGAA